MKNKFVLFLGTFLAVASLAGCSDNKEPQNNYSTEWSHDEVQHWHACTDEGHTDLKSGVAAHTFDEGVVTAPTYEANGFTTYTCTVCGYSYKGDQTRKLEHTFATEWSIDDTKGTHYHACTDEGFESLRADEEEHDWSAVITPATYEAAGYTTYTCDVCGKVKVEQGDPKLVHTFAESWTTSETHHWHACLDTGYSALKGDEAEHDFLETIVPATHTSPKQIIHTCKVCGFVTSEYEGDPIGHNFSEEWTTNSQQHWHVCIDEGFEGLTTPKENHSFEETVHAPTFDEPGYTEHTCSVCGYSYQDSPAPKKEHTYDLNHWSHDENKHWHACTDEGFEDLKVDEASHIFNAEIHAPTFEADGYTVYTCECGYSYQVVDQGSQKEHSYSTGWTKDEHKHWHECLDQGYETLKTDEAEHDFGDPVKVLPTFEEDGYWEYTCATCSYKKRIPYGTSIDDTLLFRKVKELNPSTAEEEEIDEYEVYGTVPNADLRYVFIPNEYDGLPVTQIAEGAFKGCESMLSITISDSIEAIQKDAFDGCYHLTEIINNSSLVITIGSPDFGKIALYADYVTEVETNRGEFTSEDGLTTYLAKNGETWLVRYTGEEENMVVSDVYGINAYAFHNNENVKKVTVSNTVSKIGVDAFNGCSELTDATLPSATKVMPRGLFRNCSSLVNIELTDQTEILGESVFQGCSSLTSLPLKSVQAIGDLAFQGCSSLEELVLPNTITSLGDSSFANCTKLSDLTIGSGLVTIANNAFAGCTGLTSLTLPDSLKTIGLKSFEGCNNIASLNIGANVESINDRAFADCTKLVNLTTPAKLQFIGEETFSGCTAMTTTTLNGDSLSIGGKAFVNNSKLETLTLNNGVATIGGETFSSCKLSTLTLPNSLTSIGEGAFAYNSIDTINWGTGLLSLGGTAFASNKLTSFTIPASLTSIDGSTLDGNPLTGITVADGNTAFQANSNIVYNIGEITTVYLYMKTLTTAMIAVAEGITTIGSNAFEGCASINAVQLPSTLTTIGGGAFANCTGLVGIQIPVATEVIGGSAFKNCTSITQLVFGDLTQFAAGHPEDQSHLSVIGPEAFKGCSSATGYDLGAGDAVVIPQSVQYLHEKAFEGCAAVSKFVLVGNTHGITFGPHVFKGCSGCGSAVYVIVNAAEEADQYILIMTNHENLAGPVKNGDGTAYVSYEIYAVVFIDSTFSPLAQFAWTITGRNSDNTIASADFAK